jgi:aquaporin Z
MRDDRHPTAKPALTDVQRTMRDVRFWAEALGTAVLVFGGVGAAVLASESIGVLGVALAFGLSLLVMVYAIGPISGCHINPAVTTAMLVAKRIDLKTAIGYWVAQVFGAIVAAGLVLLIAKGAPGGYTASIGGLGANGFGIHSPTGFSLGAGILTEIILTAILTFTVLSTTAPPATAGFAGLAIGLVLALVHLVGIPITNMSVNPARSIGPAVFVGGWALRQLPVFILAPLAGGVLGALTYMGIDRLSRQQPMAEVEPPAVPVSRFETKEERRKAG